MRRQDIQLLAFARQGDTAARCEVGRRYLLGTDGFARHVATGIDYLTHASVRDLPATAIIIAEGLPLQDMLAFQQEPALARAAAAGNANAQVKLAAWLATQRGELTVDTAGHLAAAAAHANTNARDALGWLAQGATDALPRLLRALAAVGALDAQAVTMTAAHRAAAGPDTALFAKCVGTALALTDGLSPELAELISRVVQRAEHEGSTRIGIDAQHVSAALEGRASQGDRHAAYALGRSLCGIAAGSLAPARFGGELNMRKGAAFLLRAADAGCEDAWMHLYRVHSDHRLSVANAQMARFFLEKAATCGLAEAQLKLGALLLREAASLGDTEHAIHWLHEASVKGQHLADELLESLVLPVEEGDQDASAAIEQIRHSDPWLAERLQLARDFGLTKLEALSVDPAEGLRPWGLVVGKNPFITQSRLSAPRAIPATTEAAMSVARRAASFFGQTRRDTGALEGDLRSRSLRQRRAFERHGLRESMFFAVATSMILESLRFGPKWAFRARQPLRLALAA